MKNKQFVSEVVNDLRALNIDDRISSRYILSKARGFVELYIKRENDQRRLYDYDNIWLTVPCVEMVPSNDVECCGIVIPKCRNWMKSKEPIPELYLTVFGPCVRDVRSIRGDIEFYKSTPRDFEKAMKRRYIDHSVKYYWLENGHLVTPDTENSLVDITGFWKDRKKAKALSSCPQGCDPEDVICNMPMDEEFDCPGYLEAQVKQDTVANLFNFYKRNVVDDIPNLSTNQKASNRG